MAVIVTLSPKAIGHAKEVAKQNGLKVNDLITQTVEAIFSGQTAYILLHPAPPSDKVDECREAVNKILGYKKGEEIGQTADSGDGEVRTQPAGQDEEKSTITGQGETIQ